MAHEKQEIQIDPESELREAAERLRQAGFQPDQVRTLVDTMRTNPDAMLQFESAYELEALADVKASPFQHAAWMLAADIIAASTPVIPFALFDLGTARLVAVVLSAILLIVLGIGRAVYAKQSIWSTVLVTLLVGGGAGAAGVIVNKLITGG